LDGRGSGAVPGGRRDPTSAWIGAGRRPGGGAATGRDLVRLQAGRGRPLPRRGATARRPLGCGAGL